MTEDYITKKEFEKVLGEVKTELDDIKDNHLGDIWTAIDGIWASVEFLFRDIGNLRWWILGSVSVLAIVIALVKLLA